MADIKTLKTKNHSEKPDNILEDAKGVFEQCVVIGFDVDGYLRISPSENMTNERLNWLLDKAKENILMDDEGYEE